MSANISKADIKALERDIERRKKDLEDLVFCYAEAQTIAEAFDVLLDLREVHKHLRAVQKKLAAARRAENGTSLDQLFRAANEIPIRDVFNLDKHGRGRCPVHGGENPYALVQSKTGGNLVYCYRCSPAKPWSNIDVVVQVEQCSPKAAAEKLLAGWRSKI